MSQDPTPGPEPTHDPPTEPLTAPPPLTPPLGGTSADGPEGPAADPAPVPPAGTASQPQTAPVAREIPAGWYPDPEGRPQSRYWDGQGWTEQTGPLLPPADPPARPAFQRVELDAEGKPVSDRSRLAAALLCAFVGVLGIHRFYVGKVGTGLLQVVTFGGFGIWTLVDLVLILVGSFRDKEERLLLNW
jgi:hypothetical protein